MGVNIEVAFPGVLETAVELKDVAEEEEEEEKEENDAAAFIPERHVHRRRADVATIPPSQVPPRGKEKGPAEAPPAEAESARKGASGLEDCVSPPPPPPWSRMSATARSISRR